MTTTTHRPTILIVGAGLGGLILRALLEKSSVPYTIFERVTTVKHLGSAMSIGPTLLPIFQQIGIYDDILAGNKYLTHVETYNEALDSVRSNDGSPIEEFTGYGHYIIARPVYYDIILKLVPAHKIRFGKRVLNVTEKNEKVTVHLSTGETHEGDIVVGADGAYSAIRERMYEQLKGKGELPKEGMEDLLFSCYCLIGQTKVLDPEKVLLRSLFWGVMTTSQNTLCWSNIHYLPQSKSKAAMEKKVQNNETTEWGSDSTQAMCDETRDFPIPLDNRKKRTMDDLYDLTPKGLISKVALEEKVFKTWYHGRVVLMGDGAVTAIHNAIALSNLICAMPTKTSADISAIFKEYQEERYPAVIESFENSQLTGKMMARGITGSLLRLVMDYMPWWMWKHALTKTVRIRPQAGFLPNIPYMGTVVPVPSPSELKASAVFRKQQHTAAAPTIV